MSTLKISKSQSKQLKQEIQNELITANQLLHSISMELQQIKCFTSSGSDFETNVKQNAELISKLAKLHQMDIPNQPSKNKEQIKVTNRAGFQKQNNLK